LSELEKKLVGTWRHEIGTDLNPDSTYAYLELGEDRRGISATVTKGKLLSIPLFNNKILNWKVNSDTLIINSLIETEGYKMTSPDNKIGTPLRNYEEKELWILKETNEDEFIAEQYDPSIPFKSEIKFIKTHKVE
jgi:hypothetical protein